MYILRKGKITDQFDGSNFPSHLRKNNLKFFLTNGEISIIIYLYLKRNKFSNDFSENGLIPL